jgi:mRNA interferase MazF
MRRGKIVLSPFPFTNLTESKLRPAVVVSDSDREDADVILAFITSVFDGRKLSATEEFVSASDKEFASTGLKKDSVFKMDKLATIEKSIIVGELGEASAGLQEKLDAKLKIALALK